MKKLFGVFVLGMFFISMMGIVAADSKSPVEVVNEVVVGAYGIAKPVLEIFVGETASKKTTGKGVDIFLAKILFLIIIFGIVWTVLNKIDFFNENDWVLWIISISVSIVSVRFMGGLDVINTILLPYSAFGIALTAGLPFVLYFFIVSGIKSKTFRKVSWALFIVVFIGLWIVRFVEEGSLVGNNFVWIYLATAGLAFLVLIFDGTITKIKRKIDVEKGMGYRDLERKHRTMDDLDKYRDLRVKLVERGATAVEIKRIDIHITKLETSLSAFP